MSTSYRKEGFNNKKSVNRNQSLFYFKKADLEHNLQTGWYLSFGNDCVEWFVREMQGSESKMYIFLRKEGDILLTVKCLLPPSEKCTKNGWENREQIRKSKICWWYEKKFQLCDENVRDQSPLTGKSRGAADWSCDRKVKKGQFFLFFF